MKHQEYEYQCAVFEWANYMCIKYPELKFMYAIINETRGITPAKGARDKRQGKKSGVPDICLPTPRGHFHGLYLEMKSDKGKPTENQKNFLEFLSTQGYYTAVCNSPEEAIKTIEEFLKK